MKFDRLSGRGGRAEVALPFSWKLFLLSLFALVLAPFERLWAEYCVCWANHKGSEGVVHVGTTAIAELRSWELTHTMEPIDDTTLSDTNRTYQSGLNGWSGSASAFWDETDTTGQEALTIGASVTIKFYPEGASSGDQFYSGTALVTGITRRAAIQGMVEVDFTFQGTGALSESTVS
jgi:hypothetical protein